MQVFLLDGNEIAPASEWEIEIKAGPQNVLALWALRKISFAERFYGWRLHLTAFSGGWEVGMVCPMGHIGKPKVK